MINKLKKCNKINLILLFALILRLPLLNGSFWMDEAAQALEVVRPLSQQLDIIADFQPPLLHLILHFAQYFSHTEWWLRTIGALIPGLITIYYTYKLAEKLFNKNVATISSLFLATSQFHIFYSQELRPYSLPTMFALMSMYYFVVETGEKKPKDLLVKYKLGLVNVLGLYSSYLFPFLMIGQLFFVFSKDLGTSVKKFEKTRNYLVTQIFPILLFLPWLPTFLKQLDAGQLVRQNLPGWESVVSIPQLKTIPLVIAKFIFGNLDVELNALFLAPTILILSPLTALLIRRLEIHKEGFWNKLFSKKEHSKLLLILSWLVIPILTAWIVSFFVPVIRPKRVLFLLPGFYILIAFLVDSFLNSKYSMFLDFLKIFRIRTNATQIDQLQKSLASILLVTVFSVNAFSTIAYYFQPQLQRENWKALYQEISTNYSPQTTVLIYSFTDKFAPIAWYDSQSYPTISTGTLFIKQIEDLSATLKTVVDYENVLVFDYLRDLSDPDREIEKELMKFGFKEVGVIDYPNIGFVRIFSKPHALIGVK